MWKAHFTLSIKEKIPAPYCQNCLLFLAHSGAKYNYKLMLVLFNRGSVSVLLHCPPLYPPVQSLRNTRLYKILDSEELFPKN